jgi:hypothetical protein
MLDTITRPMTLLFLTVHLPQSILIAIYFIAAYAIFHWPRALFCLKNKDEKILKISRSGNF